MLSPSPSRLLSGVADALDETVLPTLERGPARNQVQAAIGIVRRCASAVERFGPILHAECVDVAQSLRLISNADADLITDPAAIDGALDAADAVLAESYPSVTTLIDTALSLHAVVAEIAASAEQQESDQRTAIRALSARMIDRQDELGLSPW